jgi:hypothetical protein
VADYRHVETAVWVDFSGPPAQAAGIAQYVTQARSCSSAKIRSGSSPRMSLTGNPVHLAALVELAIGA